MKPSLLIAGLAAIVAAAPVNKRAVFSTQTYNDLSISGGVAGNAQQEALDKLAGLPDDLSTVEEADLDFLNSVNQIANDAETDAFNPAIEAADGEEADALQVRTEYFVTLANGEKLTWWTARQDQEQGSQAHCDHSEA